MLRLGTLLGLLGAVALAALVVAVAASAPPDQGNAARGRILVNAAGCWSCHGQNLAGYKEGAPVEQPDSAPFGQSFSGAFGVITAKNLTPDVDTGLGGWTGAEIERALREGTGKDGHQLHPLMPYANYAGLASQDVQDIIAYVRSVPAVKNVVPPTRLNGPVPPAPPSGGFPPTAPTSGVARGEYLVTNVAGCGDCHTPSNAVGAPDRTKMLAGNVIPTARGFQLAPNITPDQKTGLGAWSEAGIAAFLKTGERPGGKPRAAGLMAETIGVGHPAFQGFGLSQLSDDDRLAIAQYLKMIPPVENTPLLPPGATQAPPTAVPTSAPTAIPTQRPTLAPTAAPTKAPTLAPTAAPTAVPTQIPTAVPTAAPTAVPTKVAPTARAPQPTATARQGPAATATASPKTMPPTGELPVPLAELIGGMGAVVGILGVTWHRLRMR